MQKDIEILPVTHEGIKFLVYLDGAKDLATLVDPRDRRVVATRKNVKQETKYSLSNMFRRVIRWYLAQPKDREDFKREGFDLVVDREESVFLEEDKPADAKKKESFLPAWKKGWKVR